MSSPSSGFRSFSGIVTALSGVESLHWSPRFVWVKRCEADKPVRLTRSRLPSNPNPEYVGAFALADLVAGKGGGK